MQEYKNKTISFEECKQIPFIDVFLWLGIDYKNGSIFENGKATSGWKLNEDQNIVNDFTINNRPKGDPVSFVKMFMGLSSMKDASEKMTEQFGHRYGTMQKINTSTPKNDKKYIEMSTKWEKMENSTQKELDYLENRFIKYEKVCDVVKSNGGVSVPLRDYSRKVINVKTRNLDPNAKQRFWQEKGANPYGLYMGSINRDLKLIVVTEGMFDFLTFYQFFKNTVGLNNFQQGFDILKQFKKDGFKAVYFCDNDEAGKKSMEEMKKLFEDDLICLNVSQFGEYKDLNEMFCDKKGEINLVELIKNPEKYIEIFRIERFRNTGDELIDPIDSNDKIYTWGTENLNKTITPIKNYHYIVLAGETGCGKTAWTFDVARKNAQDGVRVAFVSLEMDTGAIITRDARQYAGITKDQWRDKSLITENQLIAYKKRKNFLKNLNGLHMIGFPPDEKVTVKTIESMIKYAPYDLFIIDNLDCIQKERESTRDFDHEKQIAEMLMKITTNVKKPVIILHHLRKGNDESGNPRGIDSFKGSSKITHNAENVILLHRRKHESCNNEEDKAKLNVYQLKDRDFGIGGKSVVYFNKGTFDDFWIDPNPSPAKKAIQDVFMPKEEEFDDIIDKQRTLFNKKS